MFLSFSVSAINYQISQTDWIKYSKTMSVSVKISRVCAKFIPIKMFLGHFMDQIQRATLSLAICMFSAVTSVFAFFFFVGFSGGFRAS